MATKTISLELDAYEKLKAAKVRERESFSSVVRRAVFRAEPHTGAAVLEHLRDLGHGCIPSEETFSHWERIRGEDRERPRISRSKWEVSDAS